MLLLSYSAKAMAKNFKSWMYRKTQGTSKVATVASCPGHEVWAWIVPKNSLGMVETNQHIFRPNNWPAVKNE